LQVLPPCNTSSLNTDLSPDRAQAYDSRDQKVNNQDDIYNDSQKRGAIRGTAAQPFAWQVKPAKPLLHQTSLSFFSQSKRSNCLESKTQPAFVLPII
jgi:hypothetical protein